MLLFLAPVRFPSCGGQPSPLGPRRKDSLSPEVTKKQKTNAKKSNLWVGGTQCLERGALGEETEREKIRKVRRHKSLGRGRRNRGESPVIGRGHSSSRAQRDTRGLQEGAKKYRVFRRRNRVAANNISHRTNELPSPFPREKYTTNHFCCLSLPPKPSFSTHRPWPENVRNLCFLTV